MIAAAFGDFRVHAAETGEELRWRTKKAQECMAWLLHVRGRKATREELLSALWEADEAPANEVAALHNILSSIRRTLKPFGLENLIQCRDRLYFLEDGAVFDERVRADQLCRFIEEGDAEKTARQSRWILQLAKQPYLRNIEGRWCEEARYRYETTFLKGLILSADYFAEHGRREEAIRCYQSAWALSPYDESLLLRLLTCAAGPGEARRLRRLYAEIAEQMRDELGTEPGSRLETAYQESLARCGQ